MRRHLLLLLLLLPLLSLSAQRRNAAYERYIDRYKDMAVEQMKRYRIPASITLAQGLLESGAGESRLARKANNHFGIKCHDWRGDRIYHDDDRRGECFRSYDNARESFEDHSKFLQRSRYSALFKLKITDYKGWARGLKKAGYATNPRYASQLIDIIELYELYKFDSSKKYDKYLASHNGISEDAPVIRQFNNNYYIRARSGDTFRSLAKAFGMSSRKLAKYNERDRDDRIEEGDIIYLKEKRNKAPKQYKRHIHRVRPGESMYTISQYYGIKLKSLYRINKLSPYDTIEVGQGLKVR